jgi:hypothetical protein
MAENMNDEDNVPSSHAPIFLNRRKSARWRVRIPLSVSNGRGSDGMIHNLSAIGCAIESMCSYHRGETVLLRFVLPTGEAVSLQASIRWTASGFFGAEFCSGQHEAQRRVCAYLETLPRPT